MSPTGARTGLLWRGTSKWWLALIVAGCSRSPAPASDARADAGAPAASQPLAAAANPNPSTVPSPPEVPPFATAGELEYREVILGPAAAGERLPMIVGIHGLGDNPDAFKGLFVGLHHPARLILPRAIDPYEEGWSWFPFRARDPDVGALAEGIGAAETKLAAALAQIVADRPTVGKPIVTGFSQGGMLTFAIAVRHPELVGEAIAIGGSLPPPLWPRFSPKVSVPIVALHGTADNAVAFEPTRAAVEHLRSLGYDIQLKAYPDVRHVITEEMHHDFLQGLYEALARTRDETNR